MVVSDDTEYPYGRDWTVDEVRQFVRQTYNRDAILRTILNFAASQMTRRAVLIVGAGTVQAQCSAEWQNMPEQDELRKLRAKLPDDAAILKTEVTEGTAEKLGLLAWFETVNVPAPSHIVCVPFPIGGRVAIVLIGSPRPELSHSDLTELGITAGLQLEAVIKMAKTGALPPEDQRIPPVPPSFQARQRGDSNDSSQFPFGEAHSEHSEHSEHPLETPSVDPNESSQFPFSAVDSEHSAAQDIAPPGTALAERSAPHHTMELEDFAEPAMGVASDTIRGFQPALDRDFTPEQEYAANATAFGLPVYEKKALTPDRTAPAVNASSTVFGLPLVSDDATQGLAASVEETLEAPEPEPALELQPEPEPQPEVQPEPEPQPEPQDAPHDVTLVAPQEIGNERSGAGRTLMGGLDVLGLQVEEPSLDEPEPPQPSVEGFSRTPSVNATLLGGIAPVEAAEAPSEAPQAPPVSQAGSAPTEPTKPAAGPPAAMIFRTAKFTKRKTSPAVQALPPEVTADVVEPPVAADTHTLLSTPEPVQTAPEPTPPVQTAPEPTPPKRTPPPLPPAAHELRLSKQTQQLDSPVGSNTVELGRETSNSTMMGMPVAQKPLATDDWLREFADFEEWNKAKQTDEPVANGVAQAAHEPSETRSERSEARSEADEALDKLLASTPLELDIQESFLLLDSRDKTVAFKAAADVATAGSVVLDGLASMFPGRLFVDRYQFTHETLPVISDHGPVLRALVRIGEPSLSVVQQFIGDSSLEARFYAVLLLTQLSAHSLLSELVPRMFDRDQQIRQLARNIVLAYQTTAGYEKAVVAPLRERLSLAQDDLHVEIAADVLARMRDVAAIPLLMDQLGKHREHTNKAIHQALQHITLHNWSSPYEWKQWWTNAQQEPRHTWLVAAMDAQADTLRQLAHEELQRLPGLETAYHPEQPAKLRQREQRLVEKWFSDRA